MHANMCAQTHSHTHKTHIETHRERDTHTLAYMCQTGIPHNIHWESINKAEEANLFHITLQTLLEERE